MEEDYSSDCDMCGKRKAASRVVFCATCGVDYCSDCELTHAAQHEFAEEAMWGERLDLHSAAHGEG